MKRTVLSILMLALSLGAIAAPPAPIKTKIPPRPKGATDMVNFRTAPMDSVRVGFIGLGMRGPGAVYRWANIDRTSIKALCDKHPERLAKSQKYLQDAGRPAAAEKTRRHCMMLENCVYDFFELTTLNMAQQGLFGDILHVEGSYIHNLEPFWKAYEGNWRLDFNERNRGDVYATHGMGPAAQLVNLHRGNRMTHLVSMDTKAITGPKLVEEQLKRESPGFQNADHTMTMIQTATGQTMHIQHDVMNPRPYSRMYQLTGTDGFANKYPVEGYCLREVKPFEGMPDHENLSMHDFLPQDVKEALMLKYKHPIQVETEEMARKVGGHGGMDYIMDYRLVYCLLNGLPLDQDVYDAAEWSCLGELSRISIANGNAPVEVPDFTRGAWKKQIGYHHFMKGE